MFRGNTIKNYESVNSYKINDDKSIIINDKLYINPKLNWIDDKVLFDVNDFYIAEKTKTNNPKYHNCDYFYLDIFVRFDINGEKFFYLKRTTAKKYIDQKLKWWQIFTKRKEESSIYKRMQNFFYIPPTRDVLKTIVDINKEYDDVEQFRKKILNLF